MLRPDGTADCDACGLPMFPVALEAGMVRLECANRHHGDTPVPRDDATRRAVDSWLARKGAQLHEQHERWGTDDAEEDEHER